MCGCCGNSEDSKPVMPLKKNVCCTDILFLIVYLAFWGGMIYIAVFSIIEGDALRLVFGYDSFGNTCNEANNLAITNISESGRDMEGKSNVIFMSIYDPFDAMQICVRKCPDRQLNTPKQVQDFAKNTSSMLCRYDIGVDKYDDISLYGKQGPCPSLPILKSVSILNRCIPDVREYISSAKNVTSGIIKFLNADDIARKLLSDFYTCWKEMLVLCVIALVLAGLMVLLIRFLAAIVVWVIVALAAIGSLVGTGFLWWTYVDVKNGLDADEKKHIPLLDVDISNQNAFLVFAIVATVLTLILLLILIIMRKRIALVVALFHEAGKCLAAMPLLLVQPIWTFVILLGFFVYWGVVMAFISTAGYPVANYEKSFVSVNYEKIATVRYMWWYHLIGLIWTSEFILACQQLVISGAVAKWYFTRDKSELSCLIGKSVCRLIQHHIGSVAFGAFIITLVKFPRMILMYIQNKCKGSENKCAQFWLKCCICCLWCLEKCLKFLNQNAYTIIVVEGKSFCPAAARAFSIIAANVLRVAAINSVGAFVLFLGKIGVMAATGAIGVVWLKSHASLHYYAAPVLLVCVFAYFIAYCFLSIYEMVIDTLLLCFCEDCNMNDGTEGKEYYMSTGLMEFVKDSSGKLNKLQRKSKDLVDGTVDEKEPAI